MRSRTGSARAATCMALLAVALSLTGCAGFTRWPWGTTQRWPGPMKETQSPLPEGDAALYLGGPEEVLVVRHADPVKVRPAGLAAGYPLTFYDKSVRVQAGAGITSAPGGRIEVLWPSGNSIVLFDATSGVVGSPSRGQASFVLQSVASARIDFKEADQVELPTQARLSAASGLFVLESVQPDVLRVSNRSKGPGEILFRDAVITLDGGQVVDLPMLEAGASPQQGDAGLQVARVPGYALSWSGAVEMQRENGAVRLRALGDHEIRAHGVRLRLERDETVVFEGLGANPAPE